MPSEGAIHHINLTGWNRGEGVCPVFQVAIAPGLCCKNPVDVRKIAEFSTRISMSDFKWRHFQGEVILWAVRWYCRYVVSYRDLEQMMGERGCASRSFHD